MIRQINKKDIVRIAEIWLKNSINKYSFVCENIDISPLEFWSYKLPAMIQTTLEADSYVYEISNQILGFLTMRPEDSRGYYIYELFVDEQVQGKGVGTALVKHAKSLGTYIKVSVYERANRAIQFYIKNDFVKERIKPRKEIETQQNKFDMIWRE
jgi:ribosomal protein S18 acetylase RimI-like enzyme